jgi:hypothetical protein
VVVERRVLSSLDEGMYNTTYVLRGVLSLSVRRSLLACQFFIVLLSGFSARLSMPSGDFCEKPGHDAEAKNGRDGECTMPRCFRRLIARHQRL